MRIILFSDLHLSNAKSFSKMINGYNSRMLDGINVLKQIRVYAASMPIDEVYFCGDLFDNASSLQPDLLAKLIEELGYWNEEDLPAYFLPGQHDHHALDGAIHGILPLGDYVFAFNGIESHVTRHGVNLVSCPHAKNTQIQREYLKEVGLNLDSKRKNVFLGHFLVKELLEADGVTYDVDCVSFDDFPQGFDYHFIGDYHPHIWLPDKKLMSVGITHQHSFKDDKCRGSFIDFNLDTGVFERVYVDAPIFIETDTESITGLMDPQDFYQIIVKSKQEEDIVKSGMGSLNYKIKYEEVKEEQQSNDVRIDLSFSMKPEDIIKKYMEYMGVSEDKNLYEVGISHIGECK